MVNDTATLVARINQFLSKKLSALQPHNTGQLVNAMQYTLLNGGKRMRPLLVYATAESVGIDLKIADYIAAAIEMIHAYSLIHDDLPAMDDDDLRRGQATCHIQYDEATAILAADALQALAFECLSDAPVAAEIKIKLIKDLSKAAGALGMVGGQMLDLEAENQSLNIKQLQNIHAMKTGALLLACVDLITDCKPDITSSLVKVYNDFARHFGIAYQIIDDILDLTSDTETLGKPAQSDIKNHKSTYPSLVGLSHAKEMANTHIIKAQSHLEAMPSNGLLKELLKYISSRTF